MKERGEIEDTLFFKKSVDKEVLPELKILLSKRWLKKKSWLQEAMNFPIEWWWQLSRRRWNIYLLSSMCSFHRSGWLFLSEGCRQPDDDFWHRSVHLHGALTPYVSLRRPSPPAYWYCPKVRAKGKSRMDFNTQCLGK